MFRTLLLILLSGQGIICLHNEEKILLDKSIEALNRTLNFVLEYHKLMNVDGMLGINIVQAHLTEALEQKLDADVKKNIISLKEKAETISTLQVPNLRTSPWKYYVFNNFVIPPKMWLRNVEFSYGKLNPNQKVDTGPYNVTDDVFEYANYVMRNTFSEDQSYNCLVEIATVSNETDPKPHYCSASQTCYDYMIRFPEKYDSHLPGYGVTHMLLYLQIGRGRKCILNKQEFDTLVNKECSYILWELKKNVEFGYIPQLFDLFLEQISMCGLEGFAEFLEKSYLEHTLQELNEHGGFGVKFVSWEAVADLRRRIKREADPMPHGASNHTTGLGAVVLALFIRLLLTKPFGNKAFYVK